MSILLCCLSFGASAENNTVSVIIPDYKVVIDNSSVYYEDSISPFLSYKGITCLPMTYEYTRAMNLTTAWVEGKSFMVAYNPSRDMFRLPIYDTAVVPTGYSVCVNGKNIKNIDNSKADYPILNFRGVTYFPMTWEYAVENFGWNISFDNNTFTINTQNSSSYTWMLEDTREDDAIL